MTTFLGSNFDQLWINLCNFWTIRDTKHYLTFSESLDIGLSSHAGFISGHALFRSTRRSLSQIKYHDKNFWKQVFWSLPMVQIFWKSLVLPIFWCQIIEDSETISIIFLASLIPEKSRHKSVQSSLDTPINLNVIDV